MMGLLIFGGAICFILLCCILIAVGIGSNNKDSNGRGGMGNNFIDWMM